MNALSGQLFHRQDSSTEQQQRRKQKTPNNSVLKYTEWAKKANNQVFVKTASNIDWFSEFFMTHSNGYVTDT